METVKSTSEIIIQLKQENKWLYSFVQLTHFSRSSVKSGGHLVVHPQCGKMSALEHRND